MFKADNDEKIGALLIFGYCIVIHFKTLIINILNLKLNFENKIIFSTEQRSTLSSGIFTC